MVVSLEDKPKGIWEYGVGVEALDLVNKNMLPEPMILELRFS